MDKIEKLQNLINQSQKIVFFGGAGVSTESGIKDFRSQDGLYQMQYKYPPETILSHSFFTSNPEEFYRFYKEKMNCLNATPNICHKYLYKLEKRGKLKAIVTQNIDGLHTKAGNKKVWELHGSIYRNSCNMCGKSYDVKDVFASKALIPMCTCGGIIKPEVVLYEEGLDAITVNETIKALKDADLLIVAGTSLKVYPANSFIKYYKGTELVMINKETTDYDTMATLVFHDTVGNVFSKLK